MSLCSFLLHLTLLSILFDTLCTNLCIHAPLKVHVDAAYGGAYCVCDEYRYMLDGIEDADSIAINAHKKVITYMICDFISHYTIG